MRSLIRPPAKGKLRLFRPRPPLGGSGIRYADGRVGNHQAAGTVRQRVKRGPRPVLQACPAGAGSQQHMRGRTIPVLAAKHAHVTLRLLLLCCSPAWMAFRG